MMLHSPVALILCLHNKRAPVFRDIHVEGEAYDKLKIIADYNKEVLEAWKYYFSP